MPAARRGFCKISLSALQFSSRTKAMGILWFFLIFVNLTGHGKTRKAEGGKQRYLGTGIIIPCYVFKSKYYKYQRGKLSSVFWMK